jgi:hypothetical protein
MVKERDKMNPKVKGIYNSMLTKKYGPNTWIIMERNHHPIYTLGRSKAVEIVPSGPPKSYNLKEWAKKLLGELIDG